MTIKNALDIFPAANKINLITNIASKRSTPARRDHIHVRIIA